MKATNAEPQCGNGYSWGYDTSTVVQVPGGWNLAKSKCCRGYAIWKDGQTTSPFHFPFNATDEWVAAASAFMKDMHEAYNARLEKK